jgi:hypothetical protein
MLPSRSFGCTVVFFLACTSLSTAYSQSISSRADIPDAPDPVLTPLVAAQSAAPPNARTVATDSASLQGKQTKRILGVVPNFRSVSVDDKLPPQSLQDKFMTTTLDSFDYSAFIFAGALAGISFAENSYPEFHQGAAGYGRYYWHTLADQAVENYNVEFIFPTLFKQDSRYYTLGRGGLVKRTYYSFSRVLITRTDSGNEVFNASEIVGAGSASAISTLYYPSPERTWTKIGQHWFTDVCLDGMTFVVKEFWPDINSAVFHQKQ